MTNRRHDGDDQTMCASSDDSTMLAEGLGTEVVPAAVAVPDGGEAWSDAFNIDDVVVPREWHRWRVALLAAAGILGVGTLAALLLGAGGEALERRGADSVSAPTVPAPATAAPASTTPAGPPADAMLSGRYLIITDYGTASYADSGPSDWGAPATGREGSFLRASTTCGDSGCVAVTTPEGAGNSADHVSTTLRWRDGMWVADEQSWWSPNGQNREQMFFTMRPDGRGGFTADMTTKIVAGPHEGRSMSYSSQVSRVSETQ